MRARKLKAVNADSAGAGAAALAMARRMVHAANGGAALFAPDGALIDLNAGFAEHLPRGHDAGKIRLDVLRPVDRTSAAFVEFERFAAGKISEFRAECQLAGAKDRYFWADVSLNRLPCDITPDGIAEFVVAHVIDINAWRQAQDTVASNQARYEAALDAAGHGMWQYDMKADELTLSPGWKKLRGIPEDEEVSGDRDEWLARVHPDDMSRVNRHSQQQGQGDNGFDIVEYRERHRDGHYVWIYSRGRPYEFDENGNPTRVIGTDTDITRLKAIEAELAAEKELLRVTLKSIADGVISTDADGRVRFLNQAAEAMTGWKMQDAIGRSIGDIFTSIADSDDATPLHLADDCMACGHVLQHSGYARLTGARNASIYVRQSAAPVRDEAGTIVGSVLVFRDATQRRKMQQDLEYTATHDQLTGLFNRNAMEQHLDASIRDARQTGAHHALLLMDLDHFKAVNDGAGHAAGDALLQEIGRRIKDCCRDTDCVARMGGDEFVVVLNNRSLATARKVAQRIADSISSLNFSWQDQFFRVGVSVGVATVTGDVTGQSDVLKLADTACYAAKRNGRGCVVVGG